MLTADQQRLVEQNTGLAYREAWRFIKGGAAKVDAAWDADDLMAVAHVGLCEAAKRFEPERGLRFSTFAVPTIYGRLLRYMRECGPAGLRVSRLIPRDEIPAVARLDAPLSGDDNSPTAVDMLAAPVESPEQAEVRLAVLSLPAGLRRIVHMRLAGHAQTEVARILGVSQAHVSRMEREAHQALRGALDEGGTPVTLTDKQERILAAMDSLPPASPVARIAATAGLAEVTVREMRPLVTIKLVEQKEVTAAPMIRFTLTKAGRDEAARIRQAKHLTIRTPEMAAPAPEQSLKERVSKQQLEQALREGRSVAWMSAKFDGTPRGIRQLITAYGLEKTTVDQPAEEEEMVTETARSARTVGKLKERTPELHARFADGEGADHKSRTALAQEFDVKTATAIHYHYRKWVEAGRLDPRIPAAAQSGPEADKPGQETQQTGQDVPLAVAMPDTPEHAEPAPMAGGPCGDAGQEPPAVAATGEAEVKVAPETLGIQAGEPEGEAVNNPATLAEALALWQPPAPAVAAPVFGDGDAIAKTEQEPSDAEQGPPADAIDEGNDGGQIDQSAHAVASLVEPAANAPTNAETEPTAQAAQEAGGQEDTGTAGPVPSTTMGEALVKAGLVDRPPADRLPGTGAICEGVVEQVDERGHYALINLVEFYERGRWLRGKCSCERIVPGGTRVDVRDVLAEGDLVNVKVLAVRKATWGNKFYVDLAVADASPHANEPERLTKAREAAEWAERTTNEIFRSAEQLPIVARGAEVDLGGPAPVGPAKQPSPPQPATVQQLHPDRSDLPDDAAAVDPQARQLAQRYVMTEPRAQALWNAAGWDMEIAELACDIVAGTGSLHWGLELAQKLRKRIVARPAAMLDLVTANAELAARWDPDAICSLCPSCVKRDVCPVYLTENYGEAVELAAEDKPAKLAHLHVVYSPRVVQECSAYKRE